MGGWKRRIGVILPADGDSDADFWRYVPKNVNVMMTRLRVLDDNPALTPERIRHIGGSNGIEDCALALKTSRADTIAYACTSASFQRPGIDAEIAERIREATGGIPATTTSLAVKEALRRLNITSLAVFAPYPQFINEMLRDYLLYNGFEIANFISLDLSEEDRIPDMSPREICRWGKKADSPAADGLFIACTSLSTAEVIHALESDLTKPVVTANQATMWKALQLARIGEPVQGVGKLLEMPR